MYARLASLFIVCLLTLLPAHAAPPQQYTLTDLGLVEVRGIDADSSTIVGDSGSTAAVLSPTITILGRLPGGAQSSAQSFAAGQVVGSSDLGSGARTHAFYWTQATGLIDLGTLAGPAGFSSATDVNSLGIVVGFGDNPTRTANVPYQWVGGIPSALPLLTPAGSGFAQGINEASDTVGQASNASGAHHAVLWPLEGGIVDIHPPGDTPSLARAINNSGQILGDCAGPSGSRSCLRDPATGVWQDLPSLPGDTIYGARALNDSGLVVGFSGLAHPVAAEFIRRTAVLWEDGQPFDLLPQITNGAGWTLDAAVGINNAGVIVGAGFFNGQRHGFVLTPVPPPTPEPEPEPEPQPPAPPVARVPRDLNHDGTADLLWQHVSGALAVWFMRDGQLLTGAFLTSADTQWQLIGSGDLDGDGHPDVLWQHRPTGLVGVWFMQETSVRDSALLDAAPGWTLSTVGDLNADGHADLVWRQAQSGQIAVWLMRGAQRQAGVWLPTVADLQWALVAAHDVDGDGQSDLVWQHASTGQVGVWTMAGTTLVRTRSLANTGDPLWHVAVVGDVDGDGQADLVWRHAQSGQVAVWRLHAGSLLGADIVGQADGGWELH